MQDKIVFSIVIPVYNTVNELERCVESIVSSKFEQYEVILVDDGSTDGSSELCDRLAEKYGKIKAIHKKNGGAAEARNTGIKNANGEYLLFVDSDDLWIEKDVLTELYNTHLLEKEPDIILCGVTIYQQKGTFVKERLPECVNGDKKRKLKELIKKNQYISAAYVKIINRQFFVDNNLFFIDGLLCEDIEWSARVMMACQTIEIFPISFYKRIYRDEGSATANIGRRNILDILKQIEDGVAQIKVSVADSEMQEVYFEYWAYQYAMLLGYFRKMVHETDYDEQLKKLKEYKWLLNYDNVKKVRLVHILTKIGGLRFALRILEQYMKMRK